MTYSRIDLLKKMTLIADDGSTQLYEYLPTAFNPLSIYFEKLRWIRRLRFLYEYLHKGNYKVYYLAIDGEFVGYCVVTPGGRRLNISAKDDVVLGPYFILPEYRGKGYSKILVKMTLEYCTYSYKNAYDWIHEDNIASIKTSEACGFFCEGSRLNVVGFIRKLVPNRNGSHIVYKYINKKNSLSKDVQG